MKKKRVSSMQVTIRSGTPWFNAIELKKREEANVQDVYDKIPSSKSVHLVHVETYIRAILECHNRRKKQLHQLENQRTVVVYSDAKFLRIKGYSPAPVKSRSLYRKRCTASNLDSMLTPGTLLCVTIKIKGASSSIAASC
ncbi:hypothetical protein K501DRAFT_267078 [Backusella circina FSU 941]|nr:hypothetical protein K501DRAFT_267078 [Backusella circina FSU 941]